MRNFIQSGVVGLRTLGLSALLLSCFGLLSIPIPAQAHFTHFEPRIIHLSQQDDGVQILLRIPLPFLLLDSHWQGQDKEQLIEFTTKSGAGNQLRYLLDKQAIASRFDEFTQLILNQFSFRKAGYEPAQLSVTHLHIFNSDQRRSFSSLESAEQSFQNGKIVIDARAEELFDSSIDLRMIAKDQTLDGSFRLQSDLGIHLNAIERLANIIQVHDGQGGSTRYSSLGPLDTKVTMQSDHLGEFLGQIENGIIHILIGLDHVLFVVLIALASSGWLQTLKRATIFTVGHSVTLGLGLYGAVPESAWFIPMIETLIAATILYAGISVLMKWQQGFGYLTILFVGLIHGFGFSFILGDLALKTGGIAVIELLGFNLGIEVGQIAIYLMTALVLLFHQRVDQLRRFNLQGVLTSFTVLISAYWIYERGGELWLELVMFPI